MTAEESIALIQESAGAFVPEQAIQFAEAVRQDLAYIRGGTEGSDERPPLPKVPPKYDDSRALWMVFSTFVAHFIDPIAATVTVAEFAHRTEGMPDRIVATALEVGSDPVNEIDVFGLERLRDDYHTLRELAGELGREAFGGAFSIDDFTGPQEEL